MSDIVTFDDDAATETARTPDTYTPAAHAKGASFQVVVADDGSGNGGAVTVTKLTSGSGYAVNDTITLASADIGGGNDITITVTAVNEKKTVVYDEAGDYSKCYIPYADLTTRDPVILIAGNATQDFAGVTEFGFTVSPIREHVITDSDGDTYFKVVGKDLSVSDSSVYVGYQYNYDVELPKTYYKLNPEGSQYDYTANLTIARMKFAVGLSSGVSFKLKSKGYRGEYHSFTGTGVNNMDTTQNTFRVPFKLYKNDGVVVKVDGAVQAVDTAYTFTNELIDAENGVVTFNAGHIPTAEINNGDNTVTPAQTVEIFTDTWHDVQPVQDANQYLADDVPLTEDNIFTLPIHQRSNNFNLRVFSNSPFPVALTSMMWEGQYSPRFYRRT